MNRGYIRACEGRKDDYRARDITPGYPSRETSDFDNTSGEKRASEYIDLGRDLRGESTRRRTSAETPDYWRNRALRAIAARRTK